MLNQAVTVNKRYHKINLIESISSITHIFMRSANANVTLLILLNLFSPLFASFHLHARSRINTSTVLLSLFLLSFYSVQIQLFRLIYFATYNCIFRRALNSKLFFPYFTFFLSFVYSSFISHSWMYERVNALRQCRNRRISKRF